LADVLSTKAIREAGFDVLVILGAYHGLGAAGDIFGLENGDVHRFTAEGTRLFRRTYSA
jgi:hypothetical protein